MIRINLLKPEVKDIREAPALAAPEVKVKRGFPLTTLVFILIIAALAAAFYLQRQMVSREKARLANAQQEKSRLQYVVAKLQELEQQKAVYEKKITLISQLRAQQDKAVNIMDELSRKLPEWVWLTELTCDGQNIQLKGNALSNNLIADYIYNLENSPHFDNVNLISSAQKSGRNTQYLEFSLTLSYRLPEAAQALLKKPAAKTKSSPQAKKR